MNFKKLSIIILAISGLFSCQNAVKQTQQTEYLAPTPPMGWNTYDCQVRGEKNIMEVIDYVAENMKTAGYEYIVLDGGWSKGIDEYGRGIPNPELYPNGLKSMADYAHSKGLKFGVWLIRGVYRSACEKNTQILGTDYHAADIADTTSTCWWNKSAWGINMAHPGAQPFLNSIFNMYAEWELDFVKIDDIVITYYQAEAEGYHKAMLQCGRPMVISGSLGWAPDHKEGPPVSNSKSYSEVFDMWRITGDKWDAWGDLEDIHNKVAQWMEYSQPDAWPDCDMLPFGQLHDRKNVYRWTKLSENEVTSWMTLLCIARSPLIMGGDVRKNDAFTLQLLTNPEAIEVNQQGSNQKQFFNQDGITKWVSDEKDGAKYVALFNRTDSVASISFNFVDIHLSGICTVRNLWAREDVGIFTNKYSQQILPRSCGLYKVSNFVHPVNKEL